MEHTYEDLYYERIGLPDDCIRDLTRPGDRFDSALYWIGSLGFEVARGDAIDYLTETGGWSREELQEEDPETLNARCLWVYAEVLADSDGSERE